MVEDYFPIPICPVNHPLLLLLSLCPISSYYLILLVFSFLFCPCPQFLHSAPCWAQPCCSLPSQPCCSSSRCGCQRRGVAGTEQKLPQNTAASRCPLWLEGAVLANIVLPCESALMHARYTEKLWSIFLQNSKKSLMNVGNWFPQASSEYSSFHGGKKKAYTWWQNNPSALFKVPTPKHYEWKSLNLRIILTWTNQCIFLEAAKPL